MKKIISIALCLLFVFSISACTDKTSSIEDNSNDSSDAIVSNQTPNIADLYTLHQNSDGTRSYTFADIHGNTLFERQDIGREPKINPVSDGVYELITQAGTGLSTNWAVYCDVENSKVSATFEYVLLAHDDYVIYANRENDEHSIIVQDIFDKSKYCEKYVLTDCSPVAADFTTGAKLNGEGVAIVTYLTGDDYTETEITINFPNTQKQRSGCDPLRCFLPLDRGQAVLLQQGVGLGKMAAPEKAPGGGQGAGVHRGQLIMNGVGDELALALGVGAPQ